MNSQGKRLRFSILIDSFQMKKWQVDVVKNLIEINGIDLVSIFMNDGKKSYSSAKVSIGYRLLERSVRNKGPLKIENLSSLIPETPVFRIKPEIKKNAFYFSKQDLEIVKEQKLDFMIRFGFGILKGELLTIPSMGVWSFHHADVSKFRGGPAAFWDIYHNHPLNGAILQQLTPELDKGYLLKEGYLKSINHSFKHNLFQILDSSSNWPAIVSKSILLNGIDSLNFRPIKSKAPIYKTPTNRQVIQFCFKLAYNKLQFHWQQLTKAEFWNIGVIEQPLDAILGNKLEGVNWAPRSKSSTYRADPFESLNGEDTIYFEHFDYKNYKGKINCIEYKNGTWGKEEVALELATHLSYPFTLNYQDVNYMLAENFEGNAVVLRKQINLAGEGSVLLKGKWLDPSLIHHDHKFWLFCTNKASSNHSLHLFYADQLNGPYQAHPLNPVVVDVRSARPAGTPFLNEGSWYRPGQNCSQTYGGSISLMKIEKLSATAYEESFYKEIRPIKNDKHQSGIHTLSSFGKYTLVDGKYFEFNLANFIFSLKSKMKKLFSK